MLASDWRAKATTITFADEDIEDNGIVVVTGSLDVDSPDLFVAFMAAHSRSTLGEVASQDHRHHGPDDTDWLAHHQLRRVQDKDSTASTADSVN